MPLGAFRINTLGKSQAVEESTDHLQAVTFDATDYLSHTSSTGFTDGKEQTVSFWFRMSDISGQPNSTAIYSFGNVSYAQDGCHFFVNTTGSFRIGVRNSSNSYIHRFDGSAGSFVNNTWYHVLCSFDLTSASNRYIYINDSAASGTWASYSNDNIDYTKSYYKIGAWSNDSSPYVYDDWPGELANFYMDDSYIDLSVESNRRKFISSSGTPVDAGTDGSTPTGSQPLIYIKGDAATWNSATQNVGSTSDFTMSGSVVDSSNEPVAVESTDHLQAVTFDGSSDYLSHTSSTGFTDGKQLTVSVWFRPATVHLARIYEFANAKYTQAGSEIFIVSDGRIRWGARNSSNSYVFRFDILSTGTKAYSANTWYHLLGSVDLTSTSTRHFYLNEVEITNPSDGTWSDYSNDNMDLTRNTYAIGSASDFSNKLNGDLGQIWIDDSYIDLSVESNRRKFISASGTPVDAGSDGSTPTGSQPLIYIKGDAATWNSATQNLGSTSDFTMTGSVTDSSNEPVST